MPAPAPGGGGGRSAALPPRPLPPFSRPSSLFLLTALSSAHLFSRLPACPARQLLAPRSVRDNCDGSIVQLYYGEDGLDVLNTSYMRRFDFLARNAERFAQVVGEEEALAASATARLEPHEATVAELRLLRPQIVNTLMYNN